MTSRVRSFLHVFIKSCRVLILFCACVGCAFCSAFPFSHFLFCVLHFAFSVLQVLLHLFTFSITSAPAIGSGAGTDASRSDGRSRDTSADPPFLVSEYIREQGAYLDS